METMMERASTGVGSPLRVFPTTNAERMYALDEAWNARDWDTFDADHVVVYWPERQVNANSRRTRLLLRDDDCTCFVTRFTGTFTGPLKLPDGTAIQPTGKSFNVF